MVMKIEIIHLIFKGEMLLYSWYTGDWWGKLWKKQVLGLIRSLAQECCNGCGEQDFASDFHGRNAFLHGVFWWTEVKVWDIHVLCYKRVCFYQKIMVCITFDYYIHWNCGISLLLYMTHFSGMPTITDFHRRLLYSMLC